jgi:hypothetical protein
MTVRAPSTPSTLGASQAAPLGLLVGEEDGLVGKEEAYQHKEGVYSCDADAVGEGLLTGVVQVTLCWLTRLIGASNGEGQENQETESPLS